ncbi:TPA: hypothetical protein ACYLN4_000722 [Burkholderia lata]
MSLRLEGSIDVNCEGREDTIDGSQFSLEEADWRHIGEGDYQYEALFVYSDPDDAYKLQVQATLFEGRLTIYPATLTNMGRIAKDELDVVCDGEPKRD